MPSVATDTDLFPSTVQRPNNGENADAASLSQGFNPLTQRTRYVYNRTVDRNFDVGRVPYSAVGSGAVNDAPPLSSAVAAAVAAGGGTVWLVPGKSYRLDSNITLSGVSLRSAMGAGGAPTRIIRNHAGIALTVDAPTTYERQPIVIEGIEFTDAAASSSPMVQVIDGSVDFQRCSFVGVAGTTGGELLQIDAGLNAITRLTRCYLSPATGFNAVKVITGSLTTDGQTVFKVPATYTGAIINVASDNASEPALVTIGGGTDFDASAHTSGLVIFVAAAGSYWSIAADDCLFRGGAVDSTAFSWSAGGERRLNVGDGIIWDTITTRYNAAGAALSEQSRLSLVPLSTNVQTSSATAPVGVETCRVRFTGGVASTFELPAILFQGQPLHIAIYNPSGTWGFSLTGPTTVKETQTTLSTGQVATASFLAVDLDGTGPVWLQIGKWGYAS